MFIEAIQRSLISTPVNFQHMVTVNVTCYCYYYVKTQIKVTSRPFAPGSLLSADQVGSLKRMHLAWVHNTTAEREINTLTLQYF